MPGYAPAMAAYINAPDPNVETDIPTAYVWPTRGHESRDNKYAGTFPRNTGPGTSSGDKTILHSVDVWIVWMEAGDDPEADSMFPGIVDAVMEAFRTAAMPDNNVVDPYTGVITQIANLGEDQDYVIEVSALEDQAYNRCDSRLTIPVIEVIQA
jgi:hypothetical protein